MPDNYIPPDARDLGADFDYEAAVARDIAPENPITGIARSETSRRDVIMFWTWSSFFWSSSALACSEAIFRESANSRR